ncbi:hypothetical protein INR49_032761 [Caranx melampygus]|nr:hypothetical protein INR49_032761 [Caranx melampygus]
MSAPGSTNLSSSVSYNQNSTPNGGTAPPYQNGPAQTYPSMYPPTGYYGAPPQQQSYPTIPAHSTTVPSKAPITNSAHSANYYQNNHQQPQPQQHHQHHHVPQHHVAPSPYSAPPSSAPPSQPYATLPSSAPPPSNTHTSSTPGVMPIQMGAPLHQYSTAQPASTTPVQPGYGGGPPSQVAPTVNGQGSTAQTTVHQHYDHSRQPPQSYDSYGRVAHSAGGPDADQTPSGTPSTSVHSSPGRLQGMQYGYVANSGASSASAAASGPAAAAPSSSSSDDDDDDEEEEDEDEDEEADSMPPSNDVTNQAQSYGSYGYPSMQPAYRQGPASHSDSSPTHDLYGQSSYQQYSQPFPTCPSSLRPSGPERGPGAGGGGPEAGQPAAGEEPAAPEAPGGPRAQPQPRPQEGQLQSSDLQVHTVEHPSDPGFTQQGPASSGLLLHPFRDLQQLPVITSNTIVRCRSCRTYINPFVTFLDQRRWKCNLCYRVNDVPDEFMYNPVTRSYGEPHKRPEVQNSTVEFIASSDYMLRPPQPAVYLFVLDVSHNAVESGYLKHLCESLLDTWISCRGIRAPGGLPHLRQHHPLLQPPGGLSQPQMLVVSDIDAGEGPADVAASHVQSEQGDPQCTGAALQAAFKLMSPTGGRVTVFQTQLPTLGAGKLQSREDPNQRRVRGATPRPSTDFYKKLALDCSGHRSVGSVRTQLTILGPGLASLYLQVFGRQHLLLPLLSSHPHPAQLEKFQRDLSATSPGRSLRGGLSIHTFHGNFFVRSTDLLSLANVNPDSAFAVQMSIEDSLADSSLACFQAALLYTSNKGKRRIRVHTLCLPVVNQLSDVYAGADVQAITSIDRSISSSLSDARDALMNASSADRTSTRLDERVFAMCEFKTQPLQQLMRMVHPDLYRLDNMSDQGALHLNDMVVPQPHLLHLSADRVSRDGAFLMDCVLPCDRKNAATRCHQRRPGLPNYASIPPNMVSEQGAVSEEGE